MAVRAPLLTLLLLAAPVANAATLRGDTVTLADSSVRLSDLFEDAGRDRVIGPAPDPGGRIVVESAQLAAIARQFTVDWRPASTADRVVLERPGRPFPREPVLAALRDVLLGVGIPANSDIETPSLTLPMVPQDDSARPDITQASYDPASGRFTALLSITAAAMTPFNARLSGHIQEMTDVEVTTRRMALGEVIGRADLQPARVRVGLVRGEAARLPEQAVGLAVRHALPVGAPLLLAELGRPTMVQRGSPVEVQMSTPGLSVVVQGIAMEPGAVGERVHVLNPATRIVLEAEVTGPQRARATGGGTAPLLPGAGVPQPSSLRVAVR